MSTTAISDDQAKKLGKEFSRQHPSMVLAMAKKSVTDLEPGFQISGARVKAVRNMGCEIVVTSCRGDMCHMNNCFYKFPNGPVKDDKAFFAYLPQLRNKVCGPDPLWLIKKPLAFLILVTCSALAYGTIVLGNEGMEELLAQAPRLENGISSVFGSTKTFGYFVMGSFWFSVVAHGIEASMGFHYSQKTLQLDTSTSAMWSVLTFLVGYPIFSELQELLAVHDDKKSH
ncbi:MAG: hypothetical protein SGILL_005461 [Bacillariaceae sp.]